jgi:uncharacterized protein YgiM (DUF1202 family)
MKLRVKCKLAAFVIAGSTMALTSCGKPEEVKAEEVLFEPIPEEQINDYETKNVITEPAYTDSVEETQLEVVTVDEDSIEYNTHPVSIIIASDDVNIREDKSVESNRLGLLPIGRSVELISDEDPEWYQVSYYGKIAYVSKDYAYESTKLVSNNPIILKGVLTEETKLYFDKELSQESMNLQYHEFIEVYKELDNCYLVGTIDGIGYISKDKLQVIEGNIASVDISNQQLNLYQGNELVMVTPVVTGTATNPDRVSDEGLFEIFKERHNVWITNTAYVDNMLNYNRGEGLHDAYRWRAPYEFGGNTYLYNGSHGCINMPSEAADYASEVLDIGDLVLVKK